MSLNCVMNACHAWFLWRGLKPQFEQDKSQLTWSAHVASETERFAHNGSLDSDDHWSQKVSRGRIRRRTRNSRRRNGQRSPLSRDFDFVNTNTRHLTFLHQQNLVFLDAARSSLLLGRTVECGLFFRFVHVSLDSFHGESMPQFD